MTILITIPALNEGKIIEKNIIRLYTYLNTKKVDFVIEIIDNNSTDNTHKISEKLVKKYKNIKYTYLPKRGKWYAIKESWNNASNKFDILSFIDADLATDITYFPKLIDAIQKEKYDLAIGTRYSKESKSKRTFFRQLISKGLIWLQKILFNISYNDSQCGFKAIKQNKYAKIKKYIKNNTWSGDLELLLVSEKIFRYKIKSIPVKWEEQEVTRLNFPKEILKFSKELWKLFWYLKKIKRTKQK